MDSAIDHAGSLLDKTGVRDWVWLAAFVLGTYTIYTMLLKQKLAELQKEKTWEEVKKVLPPSAFLAAFMPEPFAWLTKDVTVSIWNKFKELGWLPVTTETVK